MSVLWIIRHGQASWGSRNYDRLSSLGMRQATLLARHLREHGPRFDALYCGRMLRHRQTAEPTCRALGLEIIEDAAFDEFDAQSVWQAQLSRMAAEDPDFRVDLERIVSDERAFGRLYAKALAKWAAGDIDPAVPLSWRNFLNKVGRGLDKLMKSHGPGACVAVFTSAGPVSAAVGMALELGDEKTMDIAFQVLNTAVTRFKYSPRLGMTLSAFNDTAHLAGKDLLTHR